MLARALVYTVRREARISLYNFDWPEMTSVDEYRDQNPENSLSFYDKHIDGRIKRICIRTVFKYD